MSAAAAAASSFRGGVTNRALKVRVLDAAMSSLVDIASVSHHRCKRLVSAIVSRRLLAPWLGYHALKQLTLDDVAVAAAACIVENFRLQRVGASRVLWLLLLLSLLLPLHVTFVDHFRVAAVVHTAVTTVTIVVGAS